MSSPYLRSLRDALAALSLSNPDGTTRRGPRFRQASYDGVNSVIRRWAAHPEYVVFGRHSI